METKAQKPSDEKRLAAIARAVEDYQDMQNDEDACPDGAELVILYGDAAGAYNVEDWPTKKILAKMRELDDDYHGIYSRIVAWPL